MTGKHNPHTILTAKDKNLSTKEANKKSSIGGKERDRKVLKNKTLKAIQKQNTTRNTLLDLTSVATEMKKLGQNNSPIFMTTIDSDGIKSVTSAAGTHRHTLICIDMKLYCILLSIGVNPQCFSLY